MSGRYDSESVRKLACTIGEAVGIPAQDAAVLADSLVQADIQGVSTHGITRLNVYVRRIEKGLIDPKAELIVERRRGPSLALNAANGLGQVQASKALEMLIPLAKQYGIATATMCNSQHFGTLSYYCNKAAHRDMILFAFTNCEASMAPAGGYEPFFGTNPIAASVPTGKGFHVKIDLATSIVARGNIIAARKKGESIPEGWALDSDGNPTTDPEKALMGTVLSMAGHKGYALALLVEIMSGVLSGAAIGPQVGSMYKNMETKQDVGHFFYLLDIEAFMDVNVFKRRIDAMIDAIKAGKRVSGVDEILIPGERSLRTAAVNRSKGIPIDDITCDELKTLCKELSIPFSLKRMAACRQPS